MRPFSWNLLQLAALSGCAALDGYLTNYDIQPRDSHSSHPPTINTEIGNALLARRIGAAESTKLGHVDEVILEQLNRFGGGPSSTVFGSRQTTPDPARLLVVIEGYQGMLSDRIQPAVVALAYLCRQDYQLGQGILSSHS